MSIPATGNEFGDIYIPDGWRMVVEGEIIKEGDLILLHDNTEWSPAISTVGSTMQLNWKSRIITPKPSVSPSADFSQGWMYDEQGNIVTSDPDAIPQGFRQLLPHEIIEDGDYLNSINPEAGNIWIKVTKADDKNRRADSIMTRVITRVVTAAPTAQYEQWGEW